MLSEKNKNHPTGFKSAVADVSIDDDSYTNNMRQNADFVNRENQENDERTTFSMEDDDLDSEETYSYDRLTAQLPCCIEGRNKTIGQ